MIPVRQVLLAGDRLSAVLVNQQLAGQGVSAQVYGLRTKIFEIDTWIQDCPHTAIEAHPELSLPPWLAGLCRRARRRGLEPSSAVAFLRPPVSDCPANSTWRARWPRWMTSWTWRPRRGPHVAVPTLRRGPSPRTHRYSVTASGARSGHSPLPRAIRPVPVPPAGPCPAGPWTLWRRAPDESR